MRKFIVISIFISILHKYDYSRCLFLFPTNHYVISILHKYDYSNSCWRPADAVRPFQFYISTIIARWMTTLSATSNISILHKYDYSEVLHLFDGLAPSFQFYISTIIAEVLHLFDGLAPSFQFYISTIIAGRQLRRRGLHRISILHKYDYSSRPSAMLVFVFYFNST